MSKEIAKVEETVEKIVGYEMEEPTCKEETCLGCKVLYDDCNDAKKYTRNLMKMRMSRKISDDELKKMNDERFGPPKPKTILHWKQILGNYEQDFIKIVNKPSILDKMDVDAQIRHSKIHKELIYNGWIHPSIVDAKLQFKTIYPRGTAVEPAKKEDDFIPEIEELTQEELPF